MIKIYICLIIISVSLFYTFPQDKTKKDSKTSGEIEIKEYKGQKLGSVNDFEENSIRGVQRVDINKYKLTITGLVEDNLELSYGELKNYLHISKIITLNCVEGWSVKAVWEGIPLKELFKNAKIKKGANTIIFYAYDGYTSSLPLDFVLNRNIIIADRINGITLPEANGFPYQVVAEDRFGYKWVRWLTKIELSANKDYRGYWENNGYNNDAVVSP
jgi:DMSO/TMAO reductase YedYZ molybdopterin-dependent catalytic subunit